MKPHEEYYKSAEELKNYNNYIYKNAERENATSDNGRRTRPH
jgi:hypothetical protein